MGKKPLRDDDNFRPVDIAMTVLILCVVVAAIAAWIRVAL